jgi:hypothetical protein
VAEIPLVSPQGRRDNSKIERSFFYYENPMRQLINSALLAIGLAVGGAALAQPVSVSGVRYADEMELRGTKLTLNGAGVRFRGPFKVYTAGLYMTKKAGTTEEVLAVPGAKRMSITMLRDIDSGELGKLFTRGVEDNLDKASFSKLIPGLMRMSQLFSDIKKLNNGESFTIDWVPGTGTVISVKGVAQGEPFKEPEFFNALLRIWLGQSPADWKLKEALLGKPA